MGGSQCLPIVCGKLLFQELECLTRGLQGFFPHRDRKNHTREKKPSKWGECGKAFGRRVPLTLHKRTYTGEKSYECNQCEKTFGVRWNLTVLKRVRPGEYPINAMPVGTLSVNPYPSGAMRELRVDETPSKSIQNGVQ